MRVDPMKVVQLITRLVRGGAQRVAIETAAFLGERGHDVELWSGPETGPEGDLAPEARARGISLRIFPDLVRAVSPWRDFRAVRTLAHALRETQPHWLHTHSSKAGILGREAAHRIGLARVAHTVHGFGFTPHTSGLTREIYVRLERRAARQSRLLVFVSSADLAEARARKILVPDPPALAAPRVVRFPPAVDAAAFASEEELQARGESQRARLGLGDRLVVGFLGRLAPQKDPRAAVLSFRRMLELEPASDAILLMVGDGPEAPALRGMIERDSALSGRVVLAGLQSNPIEWLSAMDLFLLPSRWEGAPLALIEAMATGRTVIASNLGGISEYADDRCEACLLQSAIPRAWHAP
ncbi:MAG: glycosyltransferase [Candidatus Eisenbacteria bacterium]